MALEIRLAKDKSFICAAEVAESFWRRALGLMFRKELKKDRGLLIRFSPTLKSRTIHTFFMRFPIDLIFIDDENVVVELTELKPWRVYNPKTSGSSVLEVSAGIISEKGIKVGDKLDFRGPR
jgi:hypothetical protein